MFSTVPSPPTNFIAKPLSPFEVELTWEEPTYLGGMYIATFLDDKLTNGSLSFGRWYDTRVCDNIFKASQHASEPEW